MYHTRTMACRSVQASSKMISLYRPKIIIKKKVRNIKQQGAGRDKSTKNGNTAECIKVMILTCLFKLALISNIDAKWRLYSPYLSNWKAWSQYLTLTTLWANSAEDKLVIFFPENRIWHFIQTEDNLHEILNLFLGRKYFRMSSYPAC